MKIKAFLLVAMLAAATSAAVAENGGRQPEASPVPPPAASDPFADQPFTGNETPPPPAGVTETTLVPPPPAPLAARAAAPASGGGFLVKFNNADVYEVIHTLGRIAGINYLIDPRVRGVVNVHTQGSMKKEDALELLFSILRINGATAVKEGEVYHIVPMAEAKMEPLSVPAPGPQAVGALPNRPVMRAFPLQYIPATEMAKVIKPFLSTGGEAVEIVRANMLLVIDTAGNIEKHARLVELFDADAFRSAGVKLFPLKYLDPDEMAKSLDAIFGAIDFSPGVAPPAGINFVPLPRMGALLVVSATPRTLDEVGRWIGELDREATGTARGVHLYRVRNGKVADVMAVLEKLYPGRTSAVAGKPTEFKSSVAEPAGRMQAAPGVQMLTKPAAAADASAAARPKEQGGGQAGDQDHFDIIASEPANALIVRGSASEYAAILDVLKTIDVYPRQVLLEVLIGEVQLDDSLRLGVDWKYIQNYSGGTGAMSMVTGVAGMNSGFKYVYDKADRLTGAFRALATDGKVSILSSPSILAANGKKAKIMVADQVPIKTASIVANSNPPVTTETIEYKDVGVILNFTPFVNDQGIVTLEIDQEVSDVSTTTSSTTSNPTFFKRNIQTTLIATEDRSIVLGGLVKERKSVNRDGLPWLSRIWGFGWLFGSRSDTTLRTELLIFITPRVVASVEDGTRLSSEFENRVQELKQRIGEAKGIQGTRRPEPAPGK
jgi:general secretion pathway protein D